MQIKQVYRQAKTQLGLGPKSPYPIPERQLFPQEMVAHFSYHKCMSYYYKRVMERLKREFGLGLYLCGAKSALFDREALHGKGKRVLTLSDRDDIAWDRLPGYRASHFIRDPRDLIVSGYHYHRWTKEEWCCQPNFKWAYFIRMPWFEYVQPDASRHPTTESYQEFLNTLTPEQGMILELLWRKPHFEQMGRWNFHNPLIIEMRYEDIVGNELESFRALFAHYQFHPRLAERGLEWVNEFSLQNQPKGDGEHLRSGEARQWEQEFTPRVHELFKERYGTLLLYLKYERDLNW